VYIKNRWNVEVGGKGVILDYACHQSKAFFFFFGEKGSYDNPKFSPKSDEELSHQVIKLKFYCPIDGAHYSFEFQLLCGT
jgi:hypothetical protein